MTQNITSKVSTDHHNIKAEEFKQKYNFYYKDKYYNAFTLGRSKIDNELKNLVNNLTPNSKILDIGCGTGDQIKILKELGFDVFGVDPAPKMVQIAKNKLADPDKIKIASCEKLPFDDQSFDCVIMIEVLRYFNRDTIELALTEAKRVLKKDGVLFCTFVNRWSLDFFYILQKVRQIFKKKTFDSINPHCEFFSPSELEKMFKQLGYSEVKTLGNMFSPIRIIYMLNRHLGKLIAQMSENFDNYISKKNFFKPFAGHLIAIVKK